MKINSFSMKVFRQPRESLVRRTAEVFCVLTLVWICSAQQKGAKSTSKTPAPVYKNLPVSSLKALAEKGDREAQNELGLAYASGLKGQKVNFDEAFKLFRMAADQGLAGAQYNLGSLYFFGSGVPRDNQEALKWYRKSAEQGFIPAQFYLGWMHANGKGVEEDFKEAIKWFKKAADQGDSEAQRSLGILYLRGEDLNPDYVEAYKWINLSAAQGNTNAIKQRNKLSVSMTQEQIAEGQRRAVQIMEKRSGMAGSKTQPGSTPSQSPKK